MVVRKRLVEAVAKRISQRTMRFDISVDREPPVKVRAKVQNKKLVAGVRSPLEQTVRKTVVLVP